MKLKLIVDSLDEVDEKYRDLYTEKDGKYHLTEVEGIRSQTDVNNLTGSLTKERNDHKETKAKLAKFGDADPDTLASDLAELETLRTSGGKADEKVIEARVNAAKAPLERRVRELEGTNAELTTENTTLKTTEKTRRIHDVARAAAVKLQLVDTAVDDALMYAERHLDIDDAGNVVTKDISGITAGLTAEDWLSDMSKKRPHWLPPSSGGGAGGGNGTPVTGNPWSHAHWNMGEQGRIVRENPQRAEALAKAAGTVVGGLKPAPKA